MNQRIEDIHISTGSHVSSQDAHARTSPSIKLPQKTTGNLPEEIKSSGFAKASPVFKKIDEVKSELSEEEKKKALAENSIKEQESDKK